MDDDDAYMQLALDNVQGELSPLEIGIHALGAVELGEIGQGRANKGGLGQYADALGKDRSDISDYKNAAEVITSIKYGNIPIFLKKAAHLALIHKLPHGLWSIMADWLATPNGKDGPSANQTQDLVKILDKYEIPEEYEGIYPLIRLTESYLDSQKPTPDEVARLTAIYSPTCPRRNRAKSARLSHTQAPALYSDPLLPGTPGH